MKRLASVLGAAALLLTSSQAARADLIVAADIGVADGSFLSVSDNQVQTGFSEFSVLPIADGLSEAGFDFRNGEAGFPSFTQTYGNLAATVSAGTPSNLEVYDYSPTSDPTSGVTHPLGALVEDGVRAKSDNLFLTLSGLEAGEYRIRTYHHYSRPNSGNPAFNIFVNTTGSEDPTPVEENVVMSLGLTPTDITSRAFNFTADGTNDVVIRFEGGGMVPNLISPTLNGFELSSVPEPSTFGLMVVGSIAAVGGMVVRRRRAKK